MGDDFAKDLGAVQTKVNRAADDVEALFRSNEKRRDENADLKSEFRDVLHAVEEASQIANRVVEGMEELKESVDDLKSYVVKMDKRVGALEANRFDIVKFLRWWGSTRGLILIVFAVGVFNPASQEFLLELTSRILGGK